MMLLPFKDLFKLLLVAMLSSSTMFVALLASYHRYWLGLGNQPYLEIFSLLASSVSQVAFMNHYTKLVWHCLKLKQKDKTSSSYA